MPHCRVFSQCGLTRKTLILLILIILISTTYFFIPPLISRYNPGIAITISNQGPFFNTTLFHHGSPNPPSQTPSLIIVTGHLPQEDISWLSRDLPHIPTAIYAIDMPNNTLPANKGHEAMVYLTYILENYPNFPDIVLFIHPHPIAWHNNALHAHDTLTTIKSLNLNHILRQGYFNTRCRLRPGCPQWLKVDRHWWQWDGWYRPEETFLTSKFFHELHGKHVPVPEFISQPCCAQFAVSRERILGRSREFYEQYRDWLLQTELDDATSGRIFEYTWQYIFTGLWECCPSQHQCYCDGYGICFEEREEGLQRWLKVWSSKEKIDEKTDNLWKRGKGGSHRYGELAKESKRIGAELKEMKQEAMERGKHPRLRAEDCGRLWREGDGY